MRKEKKTIKLLQNVISKNSPTHDTFVTHHLCPMIFSNVIRFVYSGSRIFRNSDKTNVSSLFHGDIVNHVFSLFHLTYSEHPKVGSSHGNSAI